MHFGNPAALYLLFLWPLFALLGWYALRSRRNIAARLGAREILRRLQAEGVDAWRSRRLALSIVAIALLMFAAARPQYGKIEQTLSSAGVNVIVALDTSKSMDANDVLGSRIELAKSSLRLALNRLRGNRIGIVAFAGAAFLQCPMTLDHTLADTILRSIDTDSVGVPGTDLGEAIRIATEAFERGAGEGGRALILITDGEDHEDTAIAAAQRARDAGIVIHALAIGTQEGATLPDDQGAGFKRDATGSAVQSRMRIDTLERIAEITGGVAHAAGDQTPAVVGDITRRIEQQHKAEIMEQRQEVHQDRFQWFLLPALLLLGWAMLSRPRALELDTMRAEIR